MRDSLIFPLCILAACTGPTSGTSSSSGSMASDAAMPDDGTLLPDPTLEAVELNMITTSGTGSLLVRVMDAETATPIAGAQVSLGSGGEVFETTEPGRFLVNGPAGHASLRVAAEGYLPRVRPVGISSTPLEMTVRLHQARVAQRVTSSGGSISDGDATLIVPEGAFTSETSIAITWQGRNRIGSFGPDPFIVDETEGGLWLAFGALHVDAETEPSVPVTLRVPVPAELADHAIALFEVEPDGRITRHAAPTRNADGTFDFILPHLCEFLVADEDEDSVGVVEEAPPGAESESADGESEPLEDGDRLEDGDTVKAAQGVVRLRMALPCGCTPEYCCFRKWETATVAVTLQPRRATPGLQPLAKLSPAAMEMYEKMRAQAATPGADPNSGRRILKFKMRTRAATLGVRGTVVDVDTRECLTDEDRSLYLFEVAAGVATLATASAVQELEAGQALEACHGCTHGYVACCDQANCSQGCCTPDPDPRDRTCQPGNTQDACGAPGGICSACGSAECRGRRAVHGPRAGLSRQRRSGLHVFTPVQRA